MKVKVLIQSLVSEKYSLAWKLIFWINCALLLYLTLSPDVYHRPTFSNIDKVYHFIGFGAFAGSLTLAYTKLNAWLVVLIGAVLGVVIEIAQHFIPHRAASFGDLAADALGAAVADGFVVFLRKQVGS